MTTAQAPLRDESRFATVAETLVADLAPRLFALIEEQERGEQLDGRIVAWGMAFEDHAEMVGVCRSFLGSFGSAESARQLFSFCGKTRLIWYNPGAATPEHGAA